MNLFSSQNASFSIPTGASLIPTGLDGLINFEAEVPSPQEVNNSFFLSYQKTIPHKERFRFTGGLQLQRYVLNRRAAQNVTSLGFTFNVHTSVSKRKSNLIHWSVGYQFNALVHTPNEFVIRNSFEQYTSPTISLEEYRDQFRDTGWNHSFSVNYSYIRKRETSISLGFIFNEYTYKSANLSDFELIETARLRKTSFSLFRLNVGVEQVFYDKFILEARILASNESQAAAGFGFRLWKHNLLKLQVVTHPIPFIDNLDILERYTSANVSLDMKRYKYILGFGIFNIDFLKFGVVYRFEDRDTSTMISPSN